MRSTLNDIAKAVGVGKSTVSVVLNKKPKPIQVSEETRKKIFSAARELNYRPSFSARALTKGKTFTIGFICADIVNPYFAELVTLALKEVETHGYRLLLSLTEGKGPEQDLACVESLLERHVDGIIMISTAFQPGTKQYDYVLREKYPFVLLQYRAEGISSIGSDWQMGMDQAVTYFKGKGHARLVFLSTATPGCVKSQKEKAFATACAAQGMISDILEGPDNLDIDGVRRTGITLARTRDRPEVVIVHADSLAMSFIHGLREGGLEVPRDMKVVGIDGTEAGKIFFPPLTSIEQDRSGTVAAAVQMLLERQDDQNPPPREILLPTTFVARGSA